MIALGVGGAAAQSPGASPQRIDMAEQRQEASTPERGSGFLGALADTTLERLIREARSGSAVLRASAARREGAGAARVHAALELLPSVSGSAGYARRRLASATFPGGQAGVLPDESLWSSGLEAAWEVDLFGRLQSGLRARDALLGSAEEGVRDAEIAVTAEVLRSYFDLRGTQGQLAVARRNAENQGRTLELTRTRYDAGRGTAFDTERAQAQLSLTLAAIPLLEERVASAQHHVAVLVGRSPREMVSELSGDGGLPELPEQVPDLAAAEVVRARPDVRAAEEQVRASGALVSAARADYLPRVSLVAGAGYTASAVDALGERGTFNYTFGPVITLPVLDLGRVRARVDEAEAYEVAARAEHRHAVLLAEEELESAAVRYRTALARLGHLREAAGASERAAALARMRYEGGVADFLHVLDAERTMLAAQDQLADAETRAADAYVALFEARAGWWGGP
jgi:NodT family efflux transporter outer membrane factor (OMF) lipoprotein